MRDVYICSYSRTPIGAFQGSLSSLAATKLGSITIKSTLENVNANFSNIDEVIMGNVLSAGLGQAPARQASIGAGLDNKTECMTINKVCGSGLKSIMLADQSIKSMNSESVVAGGMENMSLAPYYAMNARKGKAFGHDSFIDSIVHDGLYDPYNNFLMGKCAEKLCLENNYSRQKQDEYAIQSYERSNFAIENGLEIFGRIKSIAVEGCDPKFMGLGPISASKKALNRAKLRIEDIDIIELNEAFASQSLACIKDLKINTKKVNLDGGAIALGHPLGATGARITGKAAQLLKRENKKFALSTQCIGLGMGIATIIESI